MNSTDKQTANTTALVMLVSGFSTLVLTVCVYLATKNIPLAMVVMLAAIKFDSLILQVRLVYGWVSRERR